MKRKRKSKKDGMGDLAALQIRMLQIQQAYRRDKRRAVLVFEGTDAAGKGGAIRRLTEKLDPRGIKVWPVGPPTPEEQGRHYLYRFWLHLPEPGQIAVFDRSWYGRVLVEKVEKLTPKAACERAYDEINAFERMLTDDGARVVKLFLEIDRREQLKRFRERALVPYKRWKLNEADIRAHGLWNEYRKAQHEMLRRTSTRAAPWHAVDANDKTRARLEVLRIVTDALSKGVELASPALDPGLRAGFEKLLGEKLEG
ncbi:MAG: polyphosphate kinase [Alphaproteobacteria bacterium]|nr:polyphosphate kinase [Alphaproteobacteria bacterium]